MSHLRRFILALVAVATLSGLTARAEGNELSITGQLDWASKYVWRGILVNDDAVVQPSLTLGFGGLALNVWGNIDTNDAYGREDNFQEVDYTLSYTQSLDETFTASVGAIYYDFPGSGVSGTTEIFASLAAAVALNPVLAVYYDIDEVEGFYASLAVSHEIGLGSVHENLALILANNIGWGSDDFNEIYLGVDDSAMVAVSPSATLKFTASEALSFSWYAKYDHLIDGDVHDAADLIGRDTSNFWFGTNFVYAF